MYWVVLALHPRWDQAIARVLPKGWRGPRRMDRGGLGYQSEDGEGGGDDDDDGEEVDYGDDAVEESEATLGVYQAPILHSCRALAYAARVLEVYLVRCPRPPFLRKWTLPSLRLSCFGHGP